MESNLGPPGTKKRLRNDPLQPFYGLSEAAFGAFYVNFPQDNPWLKVLDRSYLSRLGRTPIPIKISNFSENFPSLKEVSHLVKKIVECNSHD